MLSTTVIPRNVPRRQLHIAVQDTRVAHARFLANVSAWSMQNDVPVDIDAFTLIIAVSENLRPNMPFNFWTCADVLDTLFNAPAFCNRQRTFMPDDFAEQFQLFIACLHSTEWLDERSDSIDKLMGTFAHDGSRVPTSPSSPALAPEFPQFEFNTLAQNQTLVP